ncbi:MAG: hypothetical protein KGL20_08455 [Rhodospirillales bacterium]|nr:hypothetical protein [Rhodospirillales bacterium]
MQARIKNKLFIYCDDGDQFPASQNAGSAGVWQNAGRGGIVLLSEGAECGVYVMRRHAFVGKNT